MNQCPEDTMSLHAISSYKTKILRHPLHLRAVVQGVQSAEGWESAGQAVIYNHFIIYALDQFCNISSCREQNLLELCRTVVCLVGIPCKNLSSPKLLIPHLHLHAIWGRRVNQVIAIKWGIQHQALERFHTRDSHVA